MLIKPTIHPYAGIVRIRLEGIISAHTRGHPLIIGCKGNTIRPKYKTNRHFSAEKKQRDREDIWILLYCNLWDLYLYRLITHLQDMELAGGKRD